jgi:hypothetical protein
VVPLSGQSGISEQKKLVERNLEAFLRCSSRTFPEESRRWCPKSRSREEDVDFVDVKIDLGEMPSAIGTLPQ